MTPAMTTKAKRVPAGVEYKFPLWCKGGKQQAWSPKELEKVSIPVQRDQDRQDGRTEVIMEPTAVSPSELFAGEVCFCQDSLY